MRRRTKLVWLAVPLICGMVALSTRKTSPTYVSVDELVTHRADLAAKSLEVHGFVKALESHDGKSRFQLTGRESAIDVTYGALLPSTVSADSGEVVVVGRFQPNHGLVADSVLSKIFF